jgi:hypothetical protein
MGPSSEGRGAERATTFIFKPPFVRPEIDSGFPKMPESSRFQFGTAMKNAGIRHIQLERDKLEKGVYVRWTQNRCNKSENGLNNSKGFNSTAGPTNATMRSSITARDATTGS